MGCSQPQRSYGSRHEWFLHEAQHRRQWSCSYCGQTFLSEADFSGHIEQDHPTACAPHQLQALIDMCVTPVDSHLLEQCPLCLQEGQQLRSHLSRHLRALALFVLPKISNLDREDANSDAVQSGGSEEHEDANANNEALSNSDQMSDISEDAMIDVPEIDDQTEPVEQSLASSASPLESTFQDPLKLKLAWLESAAQALRKPLPAFLLLTKTGMYSGTTTRSFDSSTNEVLLQKLNKSSRSYPNWKTGGSGTKTSLKLCKSSL